MIGTSSRPDAHLHEERLFDCYLSVQSGEPLDPPAAEHLSDCGECAARYAELTAFMDGLRETGNAEVDAIFTADRLQQQQHDIARRLELVGRSARVIHFPQPTAVVRQMPAPARRGLPRWVATTAAAGLVAGIAAGMFLERAGHRSPAVALQTQTAQTATARTATPGGALPGGSAVTPMVIAPTPTALPDDGAGLVAGEAEGQERFMFEIEMAADRPRTAELAAYDALTPHIREVRYTVAGR